jgi:iron-sulfur cluster repair protein YtfE (RIC family)
MLEEFAVIHGPAKTLTNLIWEENILFPLFEAKAGMRGSGPTAVMRAEHRRIGDCLEAIYQKVVFGHDG